MRFTINIIAIIVIVFFTSNSAGANTLERTFSGFYLPTGTGVLGNYSGWLADSCIWSGNNDYLNDKYHIGQDIAANVEDKVYAVADGKVRQTVSVGWGDGNTAVLIEHKLTDGSKFIAVYGHVRNVKVKNGQEIKGGDFIAEIGPYSPPHLHFGIRPGDKIVAPFGILGCPAVGPISKLANETNGFVDPIEWIKFEEPALDVPIPDAVDTVFIIDSSGSMRSNDPDNKRLDAAQAYLTGAFAGDYIGVVDFDGSVRLASPLKLLPDSKDEIAASIKTIDSSGGTNIGAGVLEGCNALVASTSGNVKRAAILLTDGQGAYANQDECYSVARGWPIYTFALGSANDALLDKIAVNTGGDFTRLPTSELICEFQRVRSKIAGAEPPPCKTWRVFQFTFTRFYVKVDSGQLQATFSIDWIGSDVELTLTTPSGRFIGRDTVAPDVQHDLGDSFEIYTITNPEQGEWLVELFGADVPTDGEETVFGVSSIPRPNSSPDCTTAYPSKDLLWPPNHKYVPITVMGVTDPDGDPVTITINSIWQDEAVNALESGNTAPDANIVDLNAAEVRAERVGDDDYPGNGRVYHIGFVAEDDQGASCTSEVLVGVPYDQSGADAIDDGIIYDSTIVPLVP